MMTDGWLAPVHQLGKITGAGLAGGSGADDGDQAQAYRVGEGFEDACHLLGGLFVECRSEQRNATRCGTVTGWFGIDG